MVLYARTAHDVVNVFYVWHNIHSMDIEMMDFFRIPIDDDRLMIPLICIHGHIDSRITVFPHCILLIFPNLMMFSHHRHHHHD